MISSRLSRCLTGIALMTSIGGVAAAVKYTPCAATPPEPLREFRGVWIATVKNIDWPSRPGLTSAQQKAELLAILDTAVRLKLNAVILQVRPSCDAFYASNAEPWSEYLTGRMGQAPVPFYDPLAFAVEETHKRGLELHAWFNPYRARHASAISAVSSGHISRTRPGLVKTYGKSLWLDPGEKEVQDFSLNAVLDVVQRYDVDAVHFDDYFYPYPEKDAKGEALPFPDWSSWKHYKDAGGKLDRDAWRRENVDTFVRRVSQSIKARKPWVKFGISPFGIWRPGFPAGIKGLDAYNKIYADARKWLVEGWIDYCAPQLYWPSAAKEQSFPLLLKWWVEQNPQRRHVWPGVSHSNEPIEIVNQIRLTRRETRATGNIHWGLKALQQNRRGISDALAQELYTQPALVPASPWLDSAPPTRPDLVVDVNGGRIRLNWKIPGSASVWLWIVQHKTTGGWSTEILPGVQTTGSFAAGSSPEVISVRAVDRCGNAGPAASVQQIQPSQ